MPPKKATTEQYKTLIDLVANCDCIIWGKGTPDMKMQAWQEIANSVNAIGGIQKAPEGWKKAFTEMKSHVKSKIRGQKNLNEIEKKCANISGLYASCSGMAGLPELEFIVENDGTLTVEEQEPAVIELVEDEKLQPHASAEEITNEQISEELPKKTGTKKKPPKSTQLVQNQKTLIQQYEMYIHFKTCKYTNEEEASQNQCLQLNGKDKCAKISVANWKRVFSEWESKVKAKARGIHFEMELTGGGIPIIEILTNLEKKLLEVLSKILIFGHPNIIELGFKKNATRYLLAPSKYANHGKESENYQENVLCYKMFWLRKRVT